MNIKHETIAEVRFPATLAGNIPAYSIVSAHGAFYLQCFSDVVAGRGFTVHKWLTSNAAFRHLAFLLTPLV